MICMDSQILCESDTFWAMIGMVCMKLNEWLIGPYLPIKEMSIFFFFGKTWGGGI